MYIYYFIGFVMGGVCGYIVAVLLHIANKSEKEEMEAFWEGKEPIVEKEQLHHHIARAIIDKATFLDCPGEVRTIAANKMAKQIADAIKDDMIIIQDGYNPDYRFELDIWTRGGKDEK